MKADTLERVVEMIFIGSVVGLIMSTGAFGDPITNSQEISIARSVVGTQDVPCDKNNLMSLFTTGWSGVLDLHDRIPWGVILELSSEVSVVFVLARLSDGDLLVVCGGFVEDVVGSVGFFDLVKDFLDLRRKCCESFCHDGGFKSGREEKRRKRERCVLRVELTPTFGAGKAPHDRRKAHDVHLPV